MQYNNMDILQSLPNGWDFIDNDFLFINDSYYRMANNKKSLFGGEYKHALIHIANRRVSNEI